jgi:hypothetical protein
MELKTITQEEKSKKVLQAEERVRQAKAALQKAKREDKKQLRKEQDHHKFMIGGIVAKYFPECYDFSEHEMTRILACAFKNRDIQNMITAVVNDRTTNPPETAQFKSVEGYDSGAGIE